MAATNTNTKIPNLSISRTIQNTNIPSNPPETAEQKAHRLRLQLLGSMPQKKQPVPSPANHTKDSALSLQNTKRKQLLALKAQQRQPQPPSTKKTSLSPISMEKLKQKALQSMAKNAGNNLQRAKQTQNQTSNPKSSPSPLAPSAIAMGLNPNAPIFEKPSQSPTAAIPPKSVHSVSPKKPPISSTNTPLIPPRKLKSHRTGPMGLLGLTMGLLKSADIRL